MKLKELGVPVSAVLRRAGLPQTLMDQPRILLTTEELFAFWRAVGEISSDPAIGLQLGTETKPEHFDPIALAALSTDSFGDAMRQTARYKQLSCPEEILLDSDEEEWSIQFRWLLAEEIEPEVLTDLCFAWVLAIARHGDWNAPVAAASRTYTAALLYKGSRKPFRLPDCVWDFPECDCLSRLRCQPCFCDQQCRAPVDAGSAVG